MGALSLCATVLLGGAVWKSRAHNKLTARAELLRKLPAEERPGYVGSATCRSCHPDQHASWHRTFHRTMTQHATPEAVRGNFTNVVLRAHGEEFHLTRRGDEFFVTMTAPEWSHARGQLELAARAQGAEPPPAGTPPRVEKRVTMTTGSHHMQAYWVAGENGNQQFSLPFTYLFEEERWVPRNDVFMLPPNSPRLTQVWNNNCLGCHSTAGQPKQGAVPATRVGELGIACESCHGPGEQHVRANLNPRRRYAMRRGNKPDPTITNPARLSSKKSSEICSQCHAARYHTDQAAWLADGFDYWRRDDFTNALPLMPGHELLRLTNAHDPDEALKRMALTAFFWSDGMIRVSGREYNGLAASGCFERGDMSCISCHSMHKSDPVDQLARGMDGNTACLQCHGDIAKKLTQHTRHAANSSGSSCYNCHMPHTTYGLLKAIRSHQITSPSVQSSLDTLRPNACNLCHLDQSLAWSARHLHEWYGQAVPSLTEEQSRTPASVAWLLSGDAGQRALIAWHMGWEPAREASGSNWMLPYLAETLDDPYSVVRYIGQRSLKTLPGQRRFKFDYIAPLKERTLAKSEVLQGWNHESLSAQEKEKVLPPPKVSELLQRRDHRPVELLE